MGWTLREEETYQRCVAQMGGALNMDRALEPLLDALRHGPQGFPKAGYKDIRLARTRIVFANGGIIPALSIRFRLVPPDIVSLLHIEISMPDEMEISDEWPWK